jgi:hypothetical protein
LGVAIDRTSKLAFARSHDEATRRIAADLLRALVAALIGAADRPTRSLPTALADDGLPRT